MPRTLVLNRSTCQFTGRPWGQCRCNGCRQLRNANQDDDGDTDGQAASKAAGMASACADPYDGVGKNQCACAMRAALAGDSEGAAEAHLKAAARLRSRAWAAVDPNSDVGGAGETNTRMASDLKHAAKAHEEAAAVHSVAQGVVGGDTDSDDDSATVNQEAAAFHDLRRRTMAAGRRAVRNAQRRRAASVTANRGDVLDFRRQSMTSVVNAQRRCESHSRNARDGSGGAYPIQYDLTQSPLDRGRYLQAYGTLPASFAYEQGDQDYPTEPNAGRSGVGGSSGDGSGGETGDTYSLEDQYGAAMKYVIGGDGSGHAGASALGIVMLDPGEQAAVDAEQQRRLGLDYDPSEAYQLTTPRTMAELLARERYEGHTQNAAHYGDPDVMVLPTFNAREAQAFQRGFERGGRRRR